ncbi:MAG: metal ABC transporter substrate-binding protein [Candidatus Methanomethylicaceae archaeon]
MKKLLITSIIVLVILGVFIIKYEEIINENKIKVVATFYPLAYLVEKIGGDRVYVKTLMPYNTEPHHWSPSPSDIMEVTKADVIIFNGANLDDFLIKEILSIVNLSGKIIVNTTEGLPLININGKIDPHTWISPYMALKQAERILNALIEKDPNGKNYYIERFNELKNKLKELDIKYQEELSNKTKNIIVVNHEAFGYLAKRYGFEQIGIIGLSVEEEPSPILIKHIIEIIRNYNISVIYVDPTFPKSYADLIKKEINNIKIVELYLALGPIDNKDYLKQLEENLNALKIGLIE